MNNYTFLLQIKLGITWHYNRECPTDMLALSYASKYLDQIKSCSELEIEVWRDYNTPYAVFVGTVKQKTTYETVFPSNSPC